jgi:hypothetical protein
MYEIDLTGAQTSTLLPPSTQRPLLCPKAVESLEDTIRSTAAEALDLFVMPVRPLVEPCHYPPYAVMRVSARISVALSLAAGPRLTHPCGGLGQVPGLPRTHWWWWIDAYIVPYRTC